MSAASQKPLLVQGVPHTPTALWAGEPGGGWVTLLLSLESLGGGGGPLIQKLRISR